LTSSSPSASTSPTSKVTATSRKDLFEQVGDGVVRIGVVGCKGASVGSGLLVSPTVVLTVNHVVEGGAWFSVRTGRTAVSAHVIAAEPDRELALLRLQRPIEGHVFSFARTAPDVGTDVFALGYPGGKPLSQTAGTVSGLDRRQDVEDHEIAGMLQFDAAIAGGNSGGPVVDAAGQVVGLTEAHEPDEQNTNYAVSGRDAAAFVQHNRQLSKSMDVTTCELPVASVQDLVAVDTSAADAWDAAWRLARYFRAIDSGDYESAWNLTTRRMRGSYDGFPGFAEAESTSTVLDVHVLDVEPVDDLTDRAHVVFASLQDAVHAPTGTDQTCSVWAITYDLRLDSGFWQIDTALGSRPDRRRHAPRPRCSSTRRSERRCSRNKLTMARRRTRAPWAPGATRCC
jgi:hypothetical protein